MLKICGDVVPVSVNPSPGFQFLKVTVAKRTVLPLNTVSYVKEELQTPITGPYEIEPGPHKIIYCQIGPSVALKVVNDCNSYITFRKGTSFGHTESVEAYLGIKGSKVPGGGEHVGSGCCDLPEHLQTMYQDNNGLFST